MVLLLSLGSAQVCLCCTVISSLTALHMVCTAADAVVPDESCVRCCCWRLGSGVVLLQGRKAPAARGQQQHPRMLLCVLLCIVAYKQLKSCAPDLDALCGFTDLLQEFVVLFCGGFRLRSSSITVLAKAVRRCRRLVLAAEVW